MAGAEVCFLLGEGAGVDRGVLTRFWRVGEAEGAGKWLWDEVLTFFAARDGDLGDGGAVFGVAVEEHAQGWCSGGGGGWEGWL